MNRFSLFILLAFNFAACTQQSGVDIANFDEQGWQDDKDGCNGQRVQMREKLIKIKPQLKGLSNDQITKLLGKPNKKNLADRNQKYFIYNISCPTQQAESSTLSIRFNAVGLSYEVLVY